MGRKKKPKKIKPAFRIPSQFIIFDELWKVEYKWCLKDERGFPLSGYVDDEKKLLVLDRLCTTEEKCEVFLRLKVEAILLRRVFRSEAATLCSKDLAKALLTNFALKWKRANAV